MKILTGKLPFAEHKRDAFVITEVPKGMRPQRPSCSLVTDTVWTILQCTWDKDPHAGSSMQTVGLVLDLLCISKLEAHPPLTPQQVEGILNQWV
jgi:hypothetical protein